MKNISLIILLSAVCFMAGCSYNKLFSSATKAFSADCKKPFEVTLGKYMHILSIDSVNVDEKKLSADQLKFEDGMHSVAVYAYKPGRSEQFNFYTAMTIPGKSAWHSGNFKIKFCAVAGERLAIMRWMLKDGTRAENPRFLVSAIF